MLSAKSRILLRRWRMKHDNISAYLKENRERLGITQRELADALDIHYKTISKWENKRSIPNDKIMQEIERIFADANQNESFKKINVFGILAIICSLLFLFLLYLSIK